MPLYEYRCACGRVETAVRKIDDRHQSPDCHGPMHLQISAVRGFVENISYESPIDGRPIMSKRARAEDFQRHNCRPWEGMEAERKYAAQCKREEEAAYDKKVESWVADEYRKLPIETKQALEVAAAP